MPYFTSQFKALCQLRRTTASAIAVESGVDQSTLSRIISGDRQISFDSLGRIVCNTHRFTEGDKLSLIRAFLIDNTPDEYRDRVIINVQPASSLKEADADDLSAALHFIENSCTDPAFAAWLIQLHKMLHKVAPKKPKKS